MNLQPGTIIKSTSELNVTYFNDCSIFIVEYNREGALGFILNKPYPRSLHELQEFKQTPFPLYEGGPVDQEHLYFIHNKPNLISGGKRLTGDLCYGGEFNEAIQHINNQTISTQQLKIFIGYCGWDSGELESEIEEGSWEIVSGVPIFGL